MLIGIGSAVDRSCPSLLSPSIVAFPPQIGNMIGDDFANCSGILQMETIKGPV